MFGETESSRTGFPFKRNSIAPLILFSPALKNFQERARAQFLERQTGGERFLFCDRAASESAQEEIEQALAGRGIVEDVAKQRGKRGFFDKCFQAIGGASQTFEEKKINSGVTRDELRRVQIPALIVSGAERVQIVLEPESPCLMNGVAILALLLGG